MSRTKINEAINSRIAKASFVYAPVGANDKPTIVITEDELKTLLENFGIDVMYSKDLRDALFHANN